MAGRNFVSGFMKRNKDLSLRKPQGVALNHIYGLNKTDVGLFFENLDSVLRHYLFEPHQIYSCDETGLTCVNKPSKVIVSSATSGEKGVTTAVLCAVSATGHYVPPLMISKRKKVKPELTDNAPVGTIQGCPENGWVNTVIYKVYKALCEICKLF